MVNFVEKDQLLRRLIAKKKNKLNSIKPDTVTNDLLIRWSKFRLLKLLDMTIRSHILKHTCFVLLKKGGEYNTEQLVHHMSRFGYSSVDTSYKFVKYINKINDRYDLPISFHYENRYIRFDASKM